MKKLLFLLASTAALIVPASAQNFEGTITWSLKYTMSAGMSQQMQGAQSMMSDPAVMKEMQAAMNDPQMRAMIAANPQMKAMMDSMAKGPSAPAAGGNIMDSMVPKSITFKIKGTKSLTIVEGGMSAGEVLSFEDKNISYLIDRSSRTYSTLTEAAVAATGPSAQYKITPTNETTKILGYTCKKTLVEDRSEGAQVSTYTIWTTTELVGANSKQLSQLKLSRSGDTSFMSSIEGIPLRMEFTAPEMKMTVEATAAKKESLADSLFALPAGFTERKMMGK